MRNRKNKKQNKKISNKKDISRKLKKIKIYRYFRFVFILLLLIVNVLFFVYSYKNNFIAKFSHNLKYKFNSNIYKNTCSNIQINGVEKTDITSLSRKIDKFCKNEDTYDLNILEFEIMEDPWIKNILITRSLNDGLKIQIEEYLPFALWKDGDEYYLIDESGTIINIGEREKKLHYNTSMIIIGEEAKSEIYSLFNLLSSNPGLFSKIKVANRIGKRRWDLTLNNGILIKMPEDNLVDAWFKLDKILSIGGSEIDTKIIDLRNDDKVFIESR